MFELNYFQILCLFWAALGIGSRLLMITLGEGWNKWETEKAYRKDKPKWIYLVCAAGLLLIAYTWYSVFAIPVDYSWIIASLVSLTAIKILMLLFRYDEFREFVALTLNNKNKMNLLNGAVVTFSFVCVAMALFLY
ncbi:hypothetical protein MNBD_IGNAVI01-3066 [hydrothermal vent metagenome]|uniref:Uncharacterized protein n=1 Tax=hydrothermal vent metagenome TaxID=652676 RepID=A0A3B1CNF4_9ZZZZ